MQWPSLSDYNEAIQYPNLVFRDLELKLGKPELTPLGLPQPITGRFVCVYKLQCGHKNWAVRCFSSEVKDQQGRYLEIGKHLKSVNSPYLVDFEYLKEGIRVGQRWYPILKMEWVQGEPILSYIVRNARNPVILQQLTNRWPNMVKSLQDASIAHGDLQHGNILIVNDEF